ncbi:MAG TPA: molecular chaperone DnaJ [Reyranella sp.]|nr:molecular chaperone DnaJ [Reyranella sp.]
MPVLIAALVGLAAVAIGIYWFLRANPSALAKRARLGLLVVIGFGVLLLLLVALEVLPGLIPELFGLAGIVITGLIARAFRQRASGGFSTPGSGQRTAVRTEFLDAWIDHAGGEMGASVLKGRFAGRTLDGLGEADLRALHAECANDQDSLKILETYLDRRFGPDWRNARRSTDNPRVDMTREEALAVLGLQAGASDDDIRAAHRRLIQRMHPDVGGSADLAARINRAKDVLLGQ